MFGFGSDIVRTPKESDVHTIAVPIDHLSDIITNLKGKWYTIAVPIDHLSDLVRNSKESGTLCLFL